MRILKIYINKILWYLNQFGIDLLRLIGGLIGLPPYFYDLIKYKVVNRNHPVPLILKPCLADRYSLAANLDFEYFYQDLHVSRLIYEKKPDIHYDVGSRVDGFVSQVSLFTKVLVFDIRPLDIKVPNIAFYRRDLSDEKLCQDLIASTSSLSCLHTIEHLGLGRYGDTIASSALKNFLNNLTLILRDQGILYISFPVGQRRVEFNANNVFNLDEMILLFKCLNLHALRLYLYKNREIKDISDYLNGLNSVYEEDEGLAIFELQKVPLHNSA